jgi:hypothetical protein
MRSTPLLAALLVLGGVSFANAQGGPSEGSTGASERGSSAAQERDSGPDAGVSNRSGAPDQGSGAGAKGNDSPKGASAEKSDRSDEKGSSKSASDESSGKKSKSTATSDSDEGTGSKRMSREASEATEKSARSKDGGSSDSNASDKTDRSATDTSKGTTTDRTAEGNTSGDKAKRVDLTGDKRTKVQTAFRDAGDVKQRTNVDIDITVGRRLPRDWDFVPVPSAVIAIVPEYSGYYFAYIEDEYVIVEPDTYEVVAVLPAERSTAGTSSDGQASGSGQCSAQLSLSSKERELVLDNVRGGRAADIGDISVGRDVPSSVELQRFPDNVIAEAKALKGCQYFSAGDQIAIVDPEEDKIVLVIDES